MWRSWQDQDIRQRRSRAFRALALGLLVAGVALAGNLRFASADRLPPDPVEELRQVLRQGHILTVGIVPDPKEKEKQINLRKEQLRFREESLKARIKRIDNLGDMARALLLREWRDREDTLREPDFGVGSVDLAAREALLARFEKKFLEVAEIGTLTDKWAAANLVSRTATLIRTGGVKSEIVQSRVANLAPSLALMAREPDGNRPEEAAQVRAAAAEALGNLRGAPTEAVKALEDVLVQDKARGPRRAAAGALSTMIRILSPSERKAESSLGKLDAPRRDVINTGSAVVPLAAQHINVKKEPDAEVRRQCANAISLTARVMAEYIRDLDPRQEERFPPPGRPRSAEEKREIQRYADDVREEREAFMTLMKTLQGAAGALAVAGSDPDEEVRLRAYEALDQMGNARERLLRRQNSIPQLEPKPVVEGGGERGGEAVRASAQIPEDPLLKGLEQSLPTLIQGLSDKAAMIRLAAAAGLEMMGPNAAAAVPALVQAAGDENLFVRWASARAIGAVGADKLPEKDTALAVKKLSDLLLDDADLDVRAAAAFALGRYGPEARDAMPALAQTVSSREFRFREPELRIAAIRSIEEIGTGAVKQGVPALAEALSAPDVRVRRSAAEALNRFGPLANEARDALRKAMSDPDAEVSRAASEALLKIEPVPKSK